MSNVIDFPSRYRRAPATPLRIVGMEPVRNVSPLLVCVHCQMWTRHEHAEDRISLRSPNTIDEVFCCTQCGEARVWGRRPCAAG